MCRCVADSSERVIAGEIEHGNRNVKVLLVPLPPGEKDFDPAQCRDFLSIQQSPVFALDRRKQRGADNRVRHTGCSFRPQGKLIDFRGRLRFRLVFFRAGVGRAVSQHHQKRKPRSLPGCWWSVTLHGRRARKGVSFAKAWRLADRECIELTAGREAKGYWRLSPERRAAVIEARRENPAGTQEEIARAAGVSRATVSRIERGDRRGGAVPL
jgi:hypothetical protein